MEVFQNPNAKTTVVKSRHRVRCVKWFKRVYEWINQSGFGQEEVRMWSQISGDQEKLSEDDLVGMFLRGGIRLCLPREEGWSVQDVSTVIKIITDNSNYVVSSCLEGSHGTASVRLEGSPTFSIEFVVGRGTGVRMIWVSARHEKTGKNGWRRMVLCDNLKILYPRVVYSRYSEYLLKTDSQMSKVHRTRAASVRMRRWFDKTGKKLTAAERRVVGRTILRIANLSVFPARHGTKGAARKAQSVASEEKEAKANQALSVALQVRRDSGLGEEKAAGVGLWTSGVDIEAEYTKYINSNQCEIGVYQLV